MKSVPVQLSEDLWFPDARNAIKGGDFDGLVAVGGDLSCERLELAYRSGMFPWTVNPITWWSPDPRGILDLQSIHLTRSLSKFIRKKPFEITINKAFQDVVEACRVRPGEGTWIAPEMVVAYLRLHQNGLAHSLECWQGGELVGGIYGVSVGGCFSGESMFHRVSNASKVALYSLAVRLRERGYLLFDTQMVTSVTQQMGAVEIRRADYLKQLAIAVKKKCCFNP